jgi:hypothetical protein
MNYIFSFSLTSHRYKTSTSLLVFERTQSTQLAFQPPKFNLVQLLYFNMTDPTPPQDNGQNDSDSNRNSRKGSEKGYFRPPAAEDIPSFFPPDHRTFEEAFGNWIQGNAAAERSPSNSRKSSINCTPYLRADIRALASYMSRR